jgi:hypothetical protein
MEGKIWLRIYTCYLFKFKIDKKKPNLVNLSIELLFTLKNHQPFLGNLAASFC